MLRATLVDPLQHELQPVRIEALSLFVAEKRDERKGPLVRIYTKPRGGL